jgi:hypothetical protein
VMSKRGVSGPPTQRDEQNLNGKPGELLS